MNKFLPIALIAAAVAGCSSTKLNDTATTAPVVEDRSASPSESSMVTSVIPGVSEVSTRGPKDTAHIIYFDFDSFTLKPEALPIIEQHAKYMRSNPGKKLQLEGHTDERGGREYNLALGQKRAEAVAKGMSVMGASSEKTESVSFGMEKPAESGHGEENHAKNRRVEFVYR